MGRRERKRWVQQTLRPQVVPGKHGGWRPRAGRPRKEGAVSHRRRVALRVNTPLHVVVRCGEAVRGLRRWKVAKVLSGAFRAGCARDGFRIVQLSVMGNHIHLVIEADGAHALSEGMRAFTIRVARAINRALGRKGKVFPERYHAARLMTAKQVRAALCYVLQNARRHGLEVPAGAPDVFSSAWWFTGWSHERWRARWDPPTDGPPVAAAEGWLLKTGWRRCGLIGVDEVPAAAQARASRQSLAAGSP